MAARTAVPTSFRTGMAMTTERYAGRTPSDLAAARSAMLRP